MLGIVEDDLACDSTRSLLALHLAGMHANSPPGSVLTRLSLETGSGPAFDAALALYRKRGFQTGGAFADYKASEFNQFLHLPLIPPQ
jgi:hypothetical protein